MGRAVIPNNKTGVRGRHTLELKLRYFPQTLILCYNRYNKNYQNLVL
jgi:hypothetical protein